MNDEKNIQKKRFYGYYDRPEVKGDKLSQEPCVLFDVDAIAPPTRKEQCLRAFAVGELSTGGSKLGSIDEKTFLACKDVEELESALDECEDMGDCVKAYNKYLVAKYKQDAELVKARNEYQSKLKKEQEAFDAWRKSQQTNNTPPAEDK